LHNFVAYAPAAFHWPHELVFMRS